MEKFFHYTHVRGGYGLAALFIIWILCSGFFISCENFMNGSGLQEELNTSIEYANAEKHTILVAVTPGEGTILAGLGENEKKVTDRFHINFQVTKGYRFIKWQAVNKKNPTVIMENYISFDDASKADTYATFAKESDEIAIMPLCEKMQAIEQAEPEDERNGTARDSTIAVVLTYPLESETELEKIKINLDGINVTNAGYFTNPQLVNNGEKENIIIRVDRTNLIPVTAGSTRTVSVTFPAEMKYKSKNGNFEFEDDLIYSYKINSATGEKASLTFESSNSVGGVLKADGQEIHNKQYSIGEKLELSCKVTEGYEFDGWDLGGSLAVLLTPKQGYDYDENGLNVKTQTAEATLEILNGAEVTVKAVTKKIPTVNLKFVTSNENSGTIRLNGVTYSGETKKYSLGDEINVSFRKNDEYFFQGVSANNHIYSVEYATEDSDIFGYNSETKTAAIKIKIITEVTVDEIQTVTLYTPEIPWAEIDVSSPYGRFSNDASRKYREGEKQTIGFTSDPDYQFIKWQVIDLTTKREISDLSYIKIADSSKANTTFEFKTAPAEESGIKLSIQPLCAKRPKIVSTTPIYDSDGVYRDRRIAIMFDNEMGEDALYFEPDEIPDGMTKIESLRKPGKYYAYKNGNDDSSIVYKCLSINRRTGRKDNLLKHFSEPYYDPEDKSVIRIDTLRDNPPPASTEILVTVLPTAYQDYKVNVNEKASVLLGSEYSWAYYTNGKSDNDEPVFGDFDIRFAGRSQAVYNGSAHELVTAAITDSALIKDNNLKSKTLWIKGDFSDGGSGPAGLTWSLRKINSERFYPEEMDYEVDSGKFEELNIQGSKAEVARKIKNIETGREEFSTDGLPLDLSNGLIEEGMYRIVFTARDKNDLTATKDFFFVYDETPPAKLKGLSESRTTSGKATVSWTKPTESDFGKIEIVRKNATANTAGITDEIPYTAVNNTTYDVEDFNRYEYTARVYDFAGNVSEEVPYTDNIAPAKLRGLSESRTTSGKATVSWTKPTESDFGKVEIVRKNATTNTAGITDEIPYTAVNNTTYDVEDFNRYEYTARVYDFSGNVSEEVPYTDNIAPAKLTGLTERRTTSGKATVSWTKPTESDFGKVEVVYKNTKNGVSSAVNKYTTETSALYSVTDLNRYEYSAYVYDWSGNKSAVETFTDLTPPSASTITYVSTQAKDIVTVKKSTNNTVDFCQTDIENVIFKNGDTKKISNLGTNSRTHTITIKDYDYSGNCTTTTKNISAEVSVGMIYYTDGYWSTDYDSTRTPEGVVCKVASSNKFYIWDIWDQYGYCWGDVKLRINTPVNTNTGTVNLAHMDVNVSGIEVYDTLLKYATEEKMRYRGMSRTQEWKESAMSPSIWSYVLDKNKETVPSTVRSEKWFIPSRVEIQNIIRNLETMNTAFNKIISGYGHSERERINSTDYAYRQVQLIEIDGYYWTSMLHWDRISGAPATFQKSGNLNNDDLRWVGMYNDTDVNDLGSHTYKGESIILYQTALDNRTSDEKLFYMDRCIRYTGWSSGLTAGWAHQDMKTHAMALVELD